jgi:arsenate reductase-like glutaredoxin family protein
MSVNTIHKLDNKKKSFLYNCWVKSVVENGLMDEYIILKYPDLVQVRTVEPDKSRKNYKILPKREAKKIIDEHPYSFDIIELDVEQIKLNDFKKSKRIAFRRQQAIKYNKKTNSKILNITYKASFFVKKTISTIFKSMIKIIKNPIKIVVAIGAILTVIYLAIQLYEWYLEKFTM